MSFPFVLADRYKMAPCSQEIDSYNLPPEITPGGGTEVSTGNFRLFCSPSINLIPCLYDCHLLRLHRQPSRMRRARTMSFLWDHHSNVRRGSGLTPYTAFSRVLPGTCGVYGIEPVEMLAGALPKRQQRLVEAWAELHQAELAADWDRLQAGHKALPIAPLA